MPALKNRLPPPNSLIAFEAAARHVNFTAAARELGVTQAAVSRQIHLLEDHLGIELFARNARKSMSLTRSGETLFKATSIGLEHIATALEELRHEQNPADITVATSVTFASYWLMARVAKFQAAHRDINMRLLAAAPANNLATAGIDIAVRYGSGQWRGAEAIRLFDNDVFPVCAPSYLEGRKPLTSPTDLLDEALLNLAVYDRNWVTWESWFELIGVKKQISGRLLAFDNYMVLIQAALGGQGIALCGGRLAQDFLDRGELVRPVVASLRSAQAFYLLSRSDVPLNKAGRLFKEWILAEAKTTQGA